MNTTRLTGLLIAIVALFASANLAHAGFFNTFTFTNDAGTGISTSKTYTHAIDLLNPTPANVNGVQFVNGGTSGPNYTSNLANAFPSYGTSVGPNIGSLLSNFYYGPDNQVLTLSGLTPGRAYTYTTYVADWGGNQITFSANDSNPASLTTDRGTAGGGQGKAISYTYVAPPSGQIDLTANALSSGNTLHNYGFTNADAGYVSITDLHNTGVSTGPGFTGASGPVPDGSADPNYFGISANSLSGPFTNFTPIVRTSTGGYPIGPWLGDNTTSAWAAPSGPNAAATNGDTYWAFTTPFTTPNTADGSHPLFIEGQFSADNGIAAVLIDGVVVPGISGGGFTSWTPFTINTNIGGGLVHYLTWVTTSSGAGDPTGVRVEYSFAGFVPEPSSITLLGLGLAGLFGLKRRQRAAKG